MKIAPKWTVLALTTLALAAPGCKEACDEAGLRRAAEAFAMRTLDARQEGIVALGRACPTLPPSLGRSLLADFEVVPIDHRMAIYRDRNEDPAWNELFARACRRLPDPTVPAPSHDARMRQACDLERYGLFTANDSFVYRDITVVMLYDWLDSQRVDRALARDVVWPLLSASASPEQLEEMCLTEGLGCEHVMKDWGIELPESSIDWPPRGGTELLVSSHGLSVEGTLVLPLHAGRPAPDAFVHHVAPTLRAALAAHAADQRTAARTGGTTWDARVTLVADRATPVGTLTDTLFTATKAGFTSAELIAFGSGELHALPASAPRAWLPIQPRLRPREMYEERPLGATFIVHRGSVEARGETLSPKTFPNLPACEPSPAGCHDLEAVSAFAKQLKQWVPHESTATVRVDGDVPLQALVSILDAIRGGAACRSREMEPDEAPPDCLFHQPILDANPPLYFHADQLATLVLEGATVERDEAPVAGSPSDEALLAAFAAAREGILRCLTAAPDLLPALEDEDRIVVIYGHPPDDPDRTTARVVHRRHLDDDDERCILSALGVEPDRPTELTATPPEPWTELVIRTRFVPTTSPEDDASLPSPP